MPNAPVKKERCDNFFLSMTISPQNRPVPLTGIRRPHQDECVSNYLRGRVACHQAYAAEGRRGNDVSVEIALAVGHSRLRQLQITGM
jgi:hypothetical protein